MTRMLKECLENRVALITGASRGVGKAIAEKLSPYHMKIGILGRSEEMLQQVARTINSAGSTAFIVRADLKDQRGLTEAVAGFTAKAGFPDLLINNAGIGIRDRWRNISLSSELEITAVNYTAPLVLMRLILPNMLLRKKGHIININTIGGMYPAPYQSAYCASKAALRAYALSLAYELEKTNIRISTVYPGPIDTDFLKQANYEGFKGSKEVVSAGTIADAVLSVIQRPRESVFIGSRVKLLAVKIAGMYPEFFRKIIEKKNKPPAG